jgi:hypothetical protein
VVDYNFACRVCGLLNEVPPWGADGKTPAFEICVCCGVEYGYEDWTVEGTKKYRQAWLGSGASWNMPRFKPNGWNLEEQLANIPPQFR